MSEVPDMRVEIGDLDPQIVLVAGDWHGNHNWAKLCFQHAYKSGADAILHLGDFGFWTSGYETEHYLAEVEQAAQEWEMPLYWLDGNHEAFPRKDEFNASDRPLTTYLPRGTRWSWWDKRFMAVGGAYSVDQYMRTGFTWWPEEELSEEDIEYCSRDDGTPVDVVFAHDCPRGVSIPGIGPDAETQLASGHADWPDRMLYGADAHRQKVRRIWEATRPQLWLHGHYHLAYELGYEGTKFIGLDCDSTTLKENTSILTEAHI